MPLPPPRHIRVFLSSPGDVAEERKIVRERLMSVAETPPFADRITVRLVSYEDGKSPPFQPTEAPQHTIDSKLVKPRDCDIVVVILGARMGTPLDPATFGNSPLGKPFRSGTEREYWDAVDGRIKAGKPSILLYRRWPLREVSDLMQCEAVEDFFAMFSNQDRSLRGGYHNYPSEDHFAPLFEQHVRYLLSEAIDPMKPKNRRRITLATIGIFMIAALGFVGYALFPGRQPVVPAATTMPKVIVTEPQEVPNPDDP